MILPAYVVLILLPNSVFALSQYVGATITRAKNSDGSDYCISSGSTVQVTTSAGATITSKTTTTPVCVGQTVWSALTDLSPGTSYKLRISDGSGCRSGGFKDANRNACWYKGATSGMSCNQICSAYGVMPYSDCCEIDSGCTYLKKLFPLNCTSANCSPAVSYIYPYYDHYSNPAICHTGGSFCDEDGPQCNTSPGVTGDRICLCRPTALQFVFDFTTAP